MEELIECPVCKKLYKSLASHIKIHNLRRGDFKRLYPQSKMLSDSLTIKNTLLCQNNARILKESGFYKNILNDPQRREKLLKGQKRYWDKVVNEPESFKRKIAALSQNGLKSILNNKRSSYTYKQGWYHSDLF